MKPLVNAVMLLTLAVLVSKKPITFLIVNQRIIHLAKGHPARHQRTGRGMQENRRDRRRAGEILPGVEVSAGGESHPLFVGLHREGASSAG